MKNPVYLKCMKNLYWSSTVKMKKTTPSTAIANKFFPTKSHASGSSVCLFPTEKKKENVTIVDALKGFAFNWNKEVKTTYVAIQGK